MPIHIDLDTGQVTSTGGAASGAAPQHTPKFFSSKLTGKGKTTGLISQGLTPATNPVGPVSHPITVKNRVSNNGVAINMIPTQLLGQTVLDKLAGRGITLPAVDTASAFEITASATKLDFDAYLDVSPQALVLREDNSGDRQTRSLHVQYRMDVHVHPHGQAIPDRVALARGARRGEPFVLTSWSQTPLDDALELISVATSPLHPQRTSVYVDRDALYEWMSEYDLYGRLCDLAGLWNSDAIGKEVTQIIEDLDRQGELSQMISLDGLANQMRYISGYDVNLNSYQEIHDAITSSHMSAEHVEMMAKQNLNLLMTHSLAELFGMKDQLATPANPSDPTKLPAIFSPQQKACIGTDTVLTLVQAGAGTGKSTVILERIADLVRRGVDPQEILVLSFTNAAADNILKRNPNVKSMTIARMIHAIYAKNHPTHELSTIDTIINSLDIFYANDDVAREFRSRLMNVLRGDNKTTGSQASLNSFIEAHHAEVMNILDTIRQTSLELEIMLAYQGIDTMLEPADVSCKYLIIDEVQDNSIFEFIYMLKYAAKNKLNLFMVGDCSQTLFEFRSSNPKALNTLEGSGVFDTFKLTTNYRSNQEVLDFANIALDDIEANQYAKIQLRANSLTPVTAKSFSEKIHLHYAKMQKISEFVDTLPNYLRMYAGDYISERAAAGEQIAFLCHTRREVAAVEEFLKSEYPGKEIANIVSKKTYNSTVFSEYIKRYWDTIKQVTPAQASFTVSREIINNLGTMAGKNAEAIRKKVVGFVNEWIIATSRDVNAWVNQHGQGQMSTDEFFDNLRSSLLDFEIRKNAARQSLMSQQNNENRLRNMEQNAPFVVGTIHSAKGLEFPHAVVMYKHSNDMDESVKRMHYVALTRAQQSEFVLAYGSVVKAKIAIDHEMTIKALEDHEAKQAAIAAGLGDDDDENEDDIIADDEE